MRKRDFIILIIATLYVAGCSNVGSIQPVFTGTPEYTRSPTPSISPSSTRDISSTPISADEATIVSYATLRASICPTTTPQSEKNYIPLNDKTLQREFAGIYSFSEFWVYTILLDCDGTFHIRIWTDIGSLMFIKGRYSVNNDEIVIDGKFENNNPYNDIFMPIRWGARHYLVEKHRLASFCEIVQTPNYIKEHTGEFYLRQGDAELEITGSPISPSGDKVCQ